MTLLQSIRREAAEAPESAIVAVANRGRGKPGLIPLWVGEGDLATPSFIADAATRSLAAGETFYTWQRGIPDLREALARYHEGLYGRPFSPERFFVTQGGMQAIQIAMRIVAGPGDEVIVPEPAWPNFLGAVTVGGAKVVSMPLTLGQGGWWLDVERLAAAITSRTRAIVLNSPANPTGYTADRETLREVLALARRENLWIVADEIYGRFVYESAEQIDGRAPSFHDVMEEGDRILFVQTFSKNWAMTGWRIGWLEAPPELGPVIENLVQFSTSGVGVFLQRAAIAALEQGEDFVEHQIARAKRGRAIVSEALLASGAVDLPAPAGAFYAFPMLKGGCDSMALAIRLIDEANVGVAPGIGFGPSGEGGIRICYARKAEDLEEAMRRVAPVLARAARGD